MSRAAWKMAGGLRIPVVLALTCLALAIPAGAQKNNKDKKKADADSQSSAKLEVPLPDTQAVEKAIGEAMGYWQIGDVQSMHKYYSDDVVVVSGAWEPPVVGWDNYVKAYQAQRAQIAGARMDRSNTYIKVNGNTAWATFQFVYAAMKDDQVAQFRGHTTLFLNKQGDRWVITLNHSSVVDSSLPASAAPANSAQRNNP